MNCIRWRISILALGWSCLFGQSNQFVGSDACATCHPDQFSTWQNSTHAKAGGAPDEKRVLAPFDGDKIMLKNGWFIPFKQDGRYYFRAQETGFPEVRYEVVGVIGGGHLYGSGTQTYFGLFPDGTMRLLPFDYHPGKQTWFFETNDLSGWVPATESISPRQFSEWPPSRALGLLTEKKNCQQCHGSQIVTSFRSEKGKYQTTFTDLSINCESCHGPGKTHVSLMEYGENIIKGYTGIRSLKTVTKEESVNVCSQCHGLKDMLRPGYLPGMDFESYFSTKFAMLGGNPYFPDGRVRAFGYQQNHVFSDCYLNGSMTCVDCHNPHSNGYQDVNRNPLEGRFDNGQCTSCHMSKNENLTSHTFHKPESKGSQCTSCHMPFQQHQAVGNALKFARADHTISIPRPELDKQLGLENACQQCHVDMSTQSIADQVEIWYGELKPLHALEIALLQHELGEMSKENILSLIGSNADPEPQLFAGLAIAFMSEGASRPSDTLIKKLKILTQNIDIDIQGLALAFLDLFSDNDPSIADFTIQALAASGQNQSKVRARWSTALAYRAEQLGKMGITMSSIHHYEKSVKIWPKNTRAKMGLAEAYLTIDDMDKAVKIYGEIVQSNPADWQGWAGLGYAQSRNGQRVIAIEAYMRSLEINTFNPTAHLGIGHLLFQLKKDILAANHLAKAVELDPALTEGYIYLAGVKIRQQQLKEAASILNRGLILNPNHEIGKMMKSEIDRFMK